MFDITLFQVKLITGKPDGLKTLAQNIHVCWAKERGPKIRHHGTVIDLQEIGFDGTLNFDSILATLISKKAKFHQNCRLRFNDDKMVREIEKKKKAVEKMQRLASSLSDSSIDKPGSKKQKLTPIVLHQDPVSKTPPRQPSEVHDTSHRGSSEPSITSSSILQSELSIVSHRDLHTSTPSRPVDNASHRELIFSFQQREEEVPDTSHQGPSEPPTPSTPSSSRRRSESVNVSHRDRTSSLDHTLLSPVRKDVKTIESVLYRAVELHLRNSIDRVHQYSDIKSVSKEKLRSILNLDLSEDAALYEQINSRMSMLTLEDKFNKLKSSTCPEMFTSPDPGNSDDLVVCFTNEIPGLLKSLESVSALRASMKKRPRYAFNGRFSEDSKTRYAPPPELLSFLSKLIHGQDVQPYSPKVVHIASMIVYNQNLHRADNGVGVQFVFDFLCIKKMLI